MAESYTISIPKLREKISRLDAEIARLKGLLQSIESNTDLFDPVEEPTSLPVGRPKKDNPVIELIREYVVQQSGSFGSADIQKLLEGHKGALEASRAIKQLVAEGVIVEIIKAYGRRKGLYRKKEQAAVVMQPQPVQ